MTLIKKVPTAERGPRRHALKKRTGGWVSCREILSPGTKTAGGDDTRDEEGVSRLR